jgi:hypothetical protein
MTPGTGITLSMASYKVETQQDELTPKQIHELSYLWAKKEMPCLGTCNL